MKKLQVEEMHAFTGLGRISDTIARVYVLMLRKATVMALVALVALCLVGNAFAKDRRTWRHENGYFENTKGNDWTEKIGTKTHHFKEVKRTDDFIELSELAPLIARDRDQRSDAPAPDEQPLGAAT